MGQANDTFEDGGGDVTRREGSKFADGFFDFSDFHEGKGSSYGREAEGSCPWSV